MIKEGNLLGTQKGLIEKSVYINCFPPKEVDTQENIAAINATMKSVITRESDTPTNTFWVQRQAGYL